MKKEEEPYSIWRTEYVGHATKLAKEISKLDEKEIKLVVVGGDGTINEVVNGIADFGKIRFGIIPTGSGNDCARGLGISGKPEELLLRILESNGNQSIDLGKVSWKENDRINSRVFMISSGVGMDALVCKKAMTSRIKKVLNRIVFIGALGLMVVSVVPFICSGLFNATVSFAGTSLIIIVSVILETMKQIESQMMVRNYKGFLND